MRTTLEMQMLNKDCGRVANIQHIMMDWQSHYIALQNILKRFLNDALLRPSTSHHCFGCHAISDQGHYLSHCRHQATDRNSWNLVQHMMTSPIGNIFRVTDPLCGEFTGPRWIPRTKASDAGLWCFLWYVPEQTTEQTIETPVIWDAIVFIMKKLHVTFQVTILWYHPDQGWVLLKLL